VGAVSYLNTKPLLYGIKHHPVFQQMTLVEDYPARIAQMLIDDELDMGLIPVAATLKLKEWQIVGDFGIGADGPVASVCIFSQAPMEEIDTIYLDYQSRTSVNLARILLKEYWKKDVTFIETTGEDFRDKIEGTTAAVVIGDRALEQRQRSRYIYDLPEYWKKHTGLPFVFAAWIANKPLPDVFVLPFNDANRSGLSQLDAVLSDLNFGNFDLRNYFTNYLKYELSTDARLGMNLFLQKLRQYQANPAHLL
jgi:chorismate dehydratase